MRMVTFYYSRGAFLSPATSAFSQNAEFRPAGIWIRVG